MACPNFHLTIPKGSQTVAGGRAQRPPPDTAPPNIRPRRGRKPWIKDEWIHNLHGYIGGIIKGLDAVPLKIGGVNDHVHLLVSCKTTHRICDLIRETKKAATAWVHKEVGYAPFCWQDGYAVFSLSPNAVPGVSRYIENQAEHHRKKSSGEELMEMLNQAGIEHDPKYFE